jgi:hypothetical protein
MRKRTGMFLPILVILAMLLALFVMPLQVMAQSHPPGANSPSIGMSLSIRDASTHLPVLQVWVGEVLEFVITLSVPHLTLPEIAVDYELGTLALKIGGGSYQHVAGYNDTPVTLIPEVSESTPFAVTAPFTYTVNASDIGAGGATAGRIKFSADYGSTATYPTGVNGWYLFDPPSQDAGATAALELFVDLPCIHIEKSTNGEDADSPTGPNIAVGDPVTWVYNITNCGNVALSSIIVTDSEAGVTPAYVSGDANLNSKLDLTETWIYQASGTATAGQYANTGSVTGMPPTGAIVSDDDPSHYVASGGVGGTALPVNKWTLAAPWAVLLVCAGVVTLLILRKRRHA